MAHSHGADHHELFVEENRKYFNEFAKTAYQQDWVAKLTEQITQAVRTNIEWLSLPKRSGDAGHPVRMLDYACGNGAMTRALLDQVDLARGVDVAEQMVAAYNELARGIDIPEQRASAVLGDVLAVKPDGALSTAEFSDFDVVVMSMALHHMADPQAVVSKLVERLRSGGVIIIVDFIEDSGSDDDTSRPLLSANPDVRKTISRRRFSSREMREYFVTAGCAEDSVRVLQNEEPAHVPEAVSKVKGGLNRIFSLARAQKA